MEDARNHAPLNFGPFRVDTAYNRLYRGDRHIPLPRKRFEILLLLLQNAGRHLTKNEILQAIWPDQFVEENNLTQHVYLLRQTIEEDPRYPKYIITIPGKGYMFQVADQSTSAGMDRVMRQAEADPGSSATESASDGPASNFTVTPQSPSTIASTLGRFNLRAAAIAFTLLGLFGAAVWIFESRGLRSGSHNIEPVSIPLQTLTGFKKSLAFSFDGKMLAFASENEKSNKTDLYMRLISGGESIRLTDSPENELDLAWSPQGDRIAFLRWPEKTDGNAQKYQLIIIPTLGGSEQMIAQVEGGLDWSPDGEHLAISDTEAEGNSVGIFLITLDSQERRAISRHPSGSAVFDHLPRFDRTGLHLAFVRWESGVSSDIFIANLASGEIKQLTFDKRSIFDLRFSKENDSIFFVSNRNGNRRLWEIPINGGTPSLVTSITDEIQKITISPLNGNIAFTQHTNDTATEISPLTRPGGTSTANRAPCFINSSRSDDTPRFAPYGEQIAFISNRTGKDEIWTANFDCSQSRQLTNLAENAVGSPRWSPDGQKLIFDHHIDGQSEISMIDVNSRIVTRLTNDPFPNFLPAWSNDGQSFYYCTNRTGRNEIWKKSLDRDDAVQITRQGGFESVESPDGRLLYFTNRGQLWIHNLKTRISSPVPELSKFLIKRYWHLSNGAIYFVPNLQMEILRFDLQTRTIQPIAPLPGFATDNVPGISLNPAETLLATSYINYRFGDIILTSNWK
ncbi:MAG: winged helix-turn-helix domain-containing protein [Acidobacteriota bacterium]